MKAVWIVASSLHRTVGHEHSYTVAVAEAWRRLGRDVRILGRQDAAPEVRSMSGFVPAFTPPPEPAHALNYAARARLFAHELESGLAASGWSSDAAIFDHTIPHANLAGWRRALGKLPAATEAHLVLRYSIRLPIRSRFKRALLRGACAFLLARLGRVSLWTDTEPLRSEFQPLTRRPFGVLPIPLEPTDFRDAGPSSRSGIVLAHPGGFRPGRGSEHLPLLTRCGARIRVWGDPPPDADVRGLEIVRGDGSHRAYLDFLRNADAVLLPYPAGDYGAQSSNALVEAFALGKPALVPAGTWMESQLDGRGVAFRDAADLPRATTALLDDLTRCREAAMLARAAWLAFHNADALVRRIGV